MAFKRIIAIGLVATCVPAAASPLSEDAKAFGTRRAVEDATLSPDGSKIAMLVSCENSQTVLRVASFADGKIFSLTNSDGRPQALHWCNFAGNDNIICQFGSIEPLSNSMVSFTRLMTIRADGAKMQMLGQRASRNDAYIRQHDGGIIDWLPGSGGQVLMARAYVPEVNTTGSILGRVKDGLAVERIDLASMKSSVLESPRAAASYMSDGRGNVRIFTIEESRNEGSKLTGRTLIRYRKANSKDWSDFGIYDSRTDTGFWPLAIDADSDSLFALKKENGKQALYRVKLDGSMAAVKVASNPSVDIDAIVRLGPGQKIIGYTYAEDVRHHAYFDSTFSALQKSIAKAIPDKPLIDFMGASADGTKLLIRASGDTSPGTYYRFDRTTKSLGEIAVERPLLENRKLAKVQSIRVPAPDGTAVPAYLTLPVGSTGKNLGAVVLPHGGPSSRDEWGFDWLPQFIAARGYAVIQPQYRGSAGFGDEWLQENGFKGWRTSIGDVTAAANYLVAQGIADRNRLAIVGWSYGGYAALQSAATQPEIYKAAIAVAPVTDLAMLKREQEGFTNSALANEFIGSGPHISEGSPLRQAKSIKIPVLLVHGDHDANVGIAESDAMERALRGNGTPVEMLRFKGLDHQLDDSSARTTMLEKIGALLDRTIGKGLNR
ncbi:MAG: S9 family peptidase [Sphingomicrobium sp.]